MAFGYQPPGAGLSPMQMILAMKAMQGGQPQGQPQQGPGQSQPYDPTATGSPMDYLLASGGGTSIPRQPVPASAPPLAPAGMPPGASAMPGGGAPPGAVGAGGAGAPGAMGGLSPQIMALIQQMKMAQAGGGQPQGGPLQGVPQQ